MSTKLGAAIAVATMMVGGPIFARGGTAPDLAGYAGKYPYDKVKGVSFLGHPQVRAAIEAAVPAGDIRDDVLAGKGVTVPILKTQGRLFSRTFDPASGGDVNWAILMIADGSKAAVCYSTGIEKDVRGADWYLDGKIAFTLYEMCPSTAAEVESAVGNWPIGPIPG
ncbi:hypothetical protein [Sphingomonas alpina]|uniref:Uncharacterized protein n=1 Tax=Sphingomonas alpina TaxID=653931 RepID=A0A7H0LDY7_9SPHN|nr:hypothetical protein [Sphingomonas alpina]QNQ07890.1 hypothetical protein H3Z74_13915 [Sphingomonas alpina]